MENLKPIPMYPGGKGGKDFKITPTEAENLQKAFDKPEFRTMFNDYLQEMNDPKNREETAAYFKQLEEEGELENKMYVSPAIGYCFTTKDSTGKKCHVNITHSTDMGEMVEHVGMDKNGNKAAGTSYSVPHGLTKPKEWREEGVVCTVYDVAINTRVYERATGNSRFMTFINSIAAEGIQKQFGAKLVEVEKAKVKRNHYKGGSVPDGLLVPKRNASAEGRKKPNAENKDPLKPPDHREEDETVEISEVGKALYAKTLMEEQQRKVMENRNLQEKSPMPNYDISGMKKGFLKGDHEVPNYKVVESGSFDLTEHMKLQPDVVSGRPRNIIVKVELPKIDSAACVEVDVVDGRFKLEVPKKYKLNIELKYPVRGDDASAKFDKSKKLLTVTIPVEREESVFIKPSASATAYVDGQEDEEEEEAPLAGNPLIQEVVPAATAPVSTPAAAAATDEAEAALNANSDFGLPEEEPSGPVRTTEQERIRQRRRAEKDARRQAEMAKKDAIEDEKRRVQEEAARIVREREEAEARVVREKEEAERRAVEEAEREERAREEAERRAAEDEADRKRKEFKEAWERTDRELDAIKDAEVQRMEDRKKADKEAEDAERRRRVERRKAKEAKEQAEAEEDDETVTDSHTATEMEEQAAAAQAESEMSDAERKHLEAVARAKKMTDKERKLAEAAQQEQINEEMHSTKPRPLIPNHNREGDDLYETAKAFVPCAFYTASNLYGDVQFRFTDAPGDSFTLRIGADDEDSVIVDGLTANPPQFVLSTTKDCFIELVSGKTDMGSLIYDKKGAVNNVAKVKVFENAFDFTEDSWGIFVKGGNDFGMNKFRKLHDDDSVKKEMLTFQNASILELDE